MPFALDTPRLAANSVTSPTGVETVAKAQGGHFRGQHVSASSDPSKITVAAGSRLRGHELSRMHLNRRLLLPKLKGQSTNAEAAARIADFYDKLPNMPERAELDKLMESLHKLHEELRKKEEGEGQDVSEGDEGDEEGRGLGGRADSQNARQNAKQLIFAALQEFDSDVGHQFAALEIARKAFETDEAETVFEGVLDEAAEFYNQTDVARDVRATLAVAKIAHDAAATLETDPAAIRETYRTIIREQKNFGELFDSLAKYDPLKNCEAVIETFRAAAGADLRSLTGPSTDPGLLQSLMTELGKLKKLRTVLDGSAKLVRDTEAALGQEQKGLLNPTDVASRLLKYISKQTVALKDAMALLGQLANARAGAKVVFVNGLDYLLLLIPDEIFPNMQSRLTQKRVLKSLSDKLVDEEEREFAVEDERRRSS